MSIEERRREAFEAWMSGQLKLDSRVPQEMRDDIFRLETGYGQYENGKIQIAWASWNAAMGSVEIELPCDRSISASDDPWYMRDLCKDAIEACGLKVKV